MSNTRSEILNTTLSTSLENLSTEEIMRHLFLYEVDSLQRGLDIKRVFSASPVMPMIIENRISAEQLRRGLSSEELDCLVFRPETDEASTIVARLSPVRSSSNVTSSQTSPSVTPPVKPLEHGSLHPNKLSKKNLFSKVSASKKKQPTQDEQWKSEVDAAVQSMPTADIQRKLFLLELISVERGLNAPRTIHSHAMKAIIANGISSAQIRQLPPGAFDCLVFRGNTVQANMIVRELAHTPSQFSSLQMNR
jgi:hypothetical protein